MKRKMRLLAHILEDLFGCGASSTTDILKALDYHSLVAWEWVISPYIHSEFDFL